MAAQGTANHVPELDITNSPSVECPYDNPTEESPVRLRKRRDPIDKEKRFSNIMVEYVPWETAQEIFLGSGDFGSQKDLSDWVASEQNYASKIISEHNGKSEHGEDEIFVETAAKRPSERNNDNSGVAEDNWCKGNNATHGTPFGHGVDEPFDQGFLDQSDIKTSGYQKKEDTVAADDGAVDEIDGMKSLLSTEKYAYQNENGTRNTAEDDAEIRPHSYNKSLSNSLSLGVNNNDEVRNLKDTTSSKDSTDKLEEGDQKLGQSSTQMLDQSKNLNGKPGDDKLQKTDVPGEGLSGYRNCDLLYNQMAIIMDGQRVTNGEEVHRNNTIGAGDKPIMTPQASHPKPGRDNHVKEADAPCTDVSKKNNAKPNEHRSSEKAAALTVQNHNNIPFQESKETTEPPNNANTSVQTDSKRIDKETKAEAKINNTKHGEIDLLRPNTCTDQDYGRPRKLSLQSQTSQRFPVVKPRLSSSSSDISNRSDYSSGKSSFHHKLDPKVQISLTATGTLKKIMERNKNAYSDSNDSAFDDNSFEATKETERMLPRQSQRFSNVVAKEGMDNTSERMSDSEEETTVMKHFSFRKRSSVAGGLLAFRNKLTKEARPTTSFCKEYEKLRLKVVLVGDADSRAGLLDNFTVKHSTRSPLLSRYEHDIELELDQYSISLVNFSKIDAPEDIKHRLFQGADIIIMCYSSSVEYSFSNLATIWLPEVKRNTRNVPTMLLCTKVDDSRDTARQPSSAELRKLMKDMKAVKWMNCSVKKEDEVEGLFREAVRIIITKIEFKGSHRTGIFKYCTLL